jgi:ribulose-5-phosphate 4-epimerase/fuculose-1-phosphate aldolase
VPIADYEGVVISKALGSKRAIILAHHGYLTAGKSVKEAIYLSVYLERAARMQIRARTFGCLTPVDDTFTAPARSRTQIQKGRLKLTATRLIFDLTPQAARAPHTRHTAC